MKIKLVDIALVVGISMALGPWLLNQQPRAYWVAVSLIGGLLCAIAGYNAQAKAVGMGEPGEELLQRAWRWFQTKILKHAEAPRVEPDLTHPPHQSITPKPPRSPLSKTILLIGVAMVLLPTTFGWQVSDNMRLLLIAVGSVLLVVATRNLPPRTADDPPHGKEMAQAIWLWIRRLWSGKP